MDPSIIAAGISGLANLGGGFMSASGAANANAQNMAINEQNIAAQTDQNRSNQNFQNNVNVANWAYQDKVNQQNFDFAREQTNASQSFAREQMAFQQQMSGTAYQRAMADMRAAGLNPMLAYSQGGATTPGGAMGSASNASASGMAGQAYSGVAPKASIPMSNTTDEFGRAVGRAASSAVDGYKLMEGAKLTGSQRELTDEQTRKVGYETTNLDAQTGRHLAETDVARQERKNRELEAENIKRTGGLITANTGRAAAEAARAAADAAYRQGQIGDASKYGYGQGPATNERFMRQVEDLGQTLNKSMYGK